jgi:hypothetical protein
MRKSKEDTRAYNKAYREANAERLRAYDKERRGPGGAQREAKLVADRERSKKRTLANTAEDRALSAARMAAWRQDNPEKALEIKRRYYQSAKGRVQKRKEEAAYKAKGLRAVSERRRAERPLSEARLAARVAYSLKRRAGEKKLAEFDAFVLKEAVRLARLRELVCGGKWHVDHIVPISRGGPGTHENLQVVPASWNRSKSNRFVQRLFAI